jgi:hypothetical protein
MGKYPVTDVHNAASPFGPTLKKYITGISMNWQGINGLSGEKAVPVVKWSGGSFPGKPPPRMVS